MNVFSRVKDAFSRAKTAMFGDKQRKVQESTRVNHTQTAPKPKRGKFRHIVRWIHPSRPIRGPVFMPSREFHHASRQTCRAYLRALFFGQLSVQYPNATRRQRRRVARLSASLEYRRMMTDVTNRISDDDAAVQAASA